MFELIIAFAFIHQHLNILHENCNSATHPLLLPPPPKKMSPFVKETSQGIARKLPALIIGLVRKKVDFLNEKKTLCIYLL